MKQTRQCLALILLLAYAITGTSALPAIMLALANMDGSHSVQLKNSKCGTQLVLHHNSGNYTPSLLDHQTALARVVVSLCRPDQSGDHNLVSAHVSSQTSNERQDVKPFIKAAAEINESATSELARHLPVQWQTNTPRTWVHHHATVGSRQVPISTVQMLI